MTRRHGPILIVEVEPPQQCDGCGQIAELRPYGPPGIDGKPTTICHPCFMKDEPGNTHYAALAMFGSCTETDCPNCP